MMLSLILIDIKPKEFKVWHSNYYIVSMKHKVKQNIKILIHNCLFLIVFASVCVVEGQTETTKTKLGVAYGSGSQNRFPFDLKDYSHDIIFYKLLFNYKFKKKGKWTFEFTGEPSYNVVEHQLLNASFIKPTDGDDFMEKRALFTQKRTIKEYVLNLGIIARYTIYKNFSGYAMGSVGPMTADKATERLAKGFAFSDVFGLGMSYDIKSIRLDFRYSVRHTSNLEMKEPNNGHNTTNTEFSVLFNL